MKNNAHNKFIVNNRFREDVKSGNSDQRTVLGAANRNILISTGRRLPLLLSQMRAPRWRIQTDRLHEGEPCGGFFDVNTFILFSASDRGRSSIGWLLVWLLMRCSVAALAGRSVSCKDVSRKFEISLDLPGWEGEKQTAEPSDGWGGL